MKRSVTKENETQKCGLLPKKTDHKYGDFVLKGQSLHVDYVGTLGTGHRGGGLLHIEVGDILHIPNRNVYVLVFKLNLHTSS